MNVNLITNINFWTAVLGFTGSVLLFFFGLPPKIDRDGHQHLILQGIDKAEKKKASIYIKLGNIGMFLIAFSFLLQLIQVINQ